MTFFYCHFNPFSYLCHVLVHYVLSEQMLKWDSGESPEQTRCCKSLPNVSETLFMPLSFTEGWEGSLKRDESEDLPRR